MAAKKGETIEINWQDFEEVCTDLSYGGICVPISKNVQRNFCSCGHIGTNKEKCPICDKPFLKIMSQSRDLLYFTMDGILHYAQIFVTVTDKVVVEICKKQICAYINGILKEINSAPGALAIRNKIIQKYHPDCFCLEDLTNPMTTAKTFINCMNTQGRYPKIMEAHDDIRFTPVMKYLTKSKCDPSITEVMSSTIEDIGREAFVPNCLLGTLSVYENLSSVKSFIKSETEAEEVNNYLLTPQARPIYNRILGNEIPFINFCIFFAKVKNLDNELLEWFDLYMREVIDILPFNDIFTEFKDHVDFLKQINIPLTFETIKRRFYWENYNLMNFPKVIKSPDILEMIKNDPLALIQLIR